MYQNKPFNGIFLPKNSNVSLVEGDKESIHLAIIEKSEIARPLSF